MNKEVMIHIDHLSKTYDSGVKAVRDISFDIYKGETFGLVGESGCGKSTLGQMLVHLLKPSSGQIEMDGKDIFKLKGNKKKAFHQKVQMIFQDPYSSLNPTKKIGWMLEEPLVIHKVATKEERKEIALQMLQTVGLDASYYNKYPSTLSGGQRQRIAIAIALMVSPSFVVCDEAVSALDVSVQAQILNLLRFLQEYKELTYLFISHNLNVVSYMADRIGVMYLGEIVELAKTEEINEHPLHPYSQALFSASSLEGIKLNGEVPSAKVIPQGCPFHSRCPYCTEKCTKEKPSLKQYRDGHYVACHLERME